MIKDIYKPKLAEILPKSIQGDEKIHAAATALDFELEKMIESSKLVLHLPRLDELPSDVLEHLRYQFHCDFWREDISLADKRNQIRESLLWHRLKGTPKGCEVAISTFIQNAKIEENWEYGGLPFFFALPAAA